LKVSQVTLRGSRHRHLWVIKRFFNLNISVLGIQNLSTRPRTRRKGNGFSRTNQTSEVLHVIMILAGPKMLNRRVNWTIAPLARCTSGSRPTYSALSTQYPVRYNYALLRPQYRLDDASAVTHTPLGAADQPLWQRWVTSLMRAMHM
jgi:hypothetical protein